MRNGQRVLIIGLDGATLDIIEPMAREGKLPTFARLMREGSYGRLESVPNTWSPAAWTSFMTGTNPGKHGILYFDKRIPGSYESRYISGASRSGHTFWEALSNMGKRVGVVNVPMTYPAQHLNGFMIAGLDAPGLDSPGFAYPSELQDELGRMGYIIQPGIQTYIKSGRLAEGAHRLYETTNKRAATVHYLMDAYPDWDLFVVVFNQLDAAQHAYWRYMDGNHLEHDPEAARELGHVIPDLYIKLDHEVGRLISRCPNTIVIVMSDHGFGFKQEGAFYINEWLAAQGLLAYTKAIDRSGSSLRSLAVSMLRWGHYQIDKNLTRDTKLRLMRVVPGLRGKVESAIRLGGVDWSKTQAFCDNARDEIWINLKGRFPQGIVTEGAEYNALCQRISEELMTWRDTETGVPLVKRVYRREELYHGPNLYETPDLLVRWRDVQIHGVRAGDFILRRDNLRKSASQSPVSGGHRFHGILFLHGPGIRQGIKLTGPSIMDIAPTISYLFNAGISSDFDGRVLLDVFEDYLIQKTSPGQSDQSRAHGDLPDQPTIGYSEEEVEQIAERLRGLGYFS